MSDDEKSAKFFTARDTVALGNAATHSIFPSGISFALLVESGILTGSGSDRESRVFEFSDRYAFSFGISTPPFFNAAVISAENSQGPRNASEPLISDGEGSSFFTTISACADLPKSEYFIFANTEDLKPGIVPSTGLRGAMSASDKSTLAVVSALAKFSKKVPSNATTRVPRPPSTSSVILEPSSKPFTAAFAEILFFPKSAESEAISISNAPDIGFKPFSISMPDADIFADAFELSGAITAISASKFPSSNSHCERVCIIPPSSFCGLSTAALA